MATIINERTTARPGLKKSLKLWQVVMMGQAYLTPMTVFDTFGIVSGVSNGHVPASYILALVGIVALSALYFDLVTATALINFGALVAFTFVNLSVINHFYRREGRNKTWKDKFHYLILPLTGAATVGVLWINLESTSLTLGLIWAAAGMSYLVYLIRRSGQISPRFDEVSSEAE